MGQARRRGGTSLAILATLGWMVAGCSTGGVPSLAEPLSAASTAQPVRGGILQLVHTGLYRTLDPVQEVAPFALLGVGPVYDTIVKFDPADPTDSRIVPALAERWQQTDDKTYVFTFREGVRWHDDVPFTADDARFSLDRISNPPRGIVSPRRDWFANVASLETPDPQTLKVSLKRPQASFLSFLAAGWTVVVPKHVVDPDPEGLNLRALGTGPFRFERATAGSEGILTRNDRYFVPGKPHLDGIRWVVIQDSSTVQAALQSRRIDTRIVNRATDADAVRTQLPHVTLQSPPASLMVTLRLRMDRPPFDDTRVRQAVHLAIDRDEVMRGAVQGYGYLPSPMPPTGVWGIAEDELRRLPGFRKPKDQDVAKARQLMAEAGYAIGFPVKMLLGQYDYVDNAGIVVAEHLKPLGITFEYEKADFSTVLQRVAAGQFEVVPYLAGLRVDDPDEWLMANYKTGAVRNNGRLSDALLDDLLDRQSISLDPLKRRDLAREINMRVLDLAAQPGLFWLKAEVAVQPWVKGWTAHGNSTNDYHHLDTWIDPALKP